eukprot:5115801-Prymnesium_polylepis.1
MKVRTSLPRSGRASVSLSEQRKWNSFTRTFKWKKSSSDTFFTFARTRRGRQGKWTSGTGRQGKRTPLEAGRRAAGTSVRVSPAPEYLTRRGRPSSQVRPPRKRTSMGACPRSAPRAAISQTP